MSDCPKCKRPNDRAVATDGSEVAPRPGDLSVCFGCGAFLTFNEDLSERELTAKEMTRLKQSERAALQNAHKVLQRVKRHVN